MPVLAVYTSKGGQGKTSIATNLATAVELAPDRMLIEIDAQGDSGLILGMRADVKTLAMKQQRFLAALKDRKNAAGIAIQTKSYTWYASPDRHLHDFLADKTIGLFALRNIIEPLRKKFFVILDMPPEESILSIFGLVAADAILIPVTMDETGIAGLARSIAFIHSKVQPKLPEQLRILGVVQNRVSSGESETPLWKDAELKLKKICAEESLPLFPCIRERRAIRTAQAAHETVWSWPAATDSRNDFIMLSRKILEAF